LVADRASFEGFYRENLARVVKACTLILLDRSTAEDVAAEAFTRLWSRWGVIGDDDHAGGYVFKTAMRLCSKRVRQRARERAASLLEV
jgi:RNA polymerase sigma-70 factor (ECF subfamily)